MIPIRCYTCGKVTASAHAELERRVSEGKPSGEALDCLGMQRICCRRMLVSHPSSLDELCRAHDQSMRRMPIRFDTVVQGPRAVDAIRRDAPAPAPMQRLYPLRDDPSSVLYRFPTSEPAALALLVDRLVDRPDVAFAWTEAPHPLSPANDLLVSMVDGGGVTSSLSAIDRAIREALSDVSTHFETTLSRLTSMPDEAGAARGEMILRDGGYTFANTLRRVLLAHVPAWAICSVRFTVNTSSYSDDMLASRLVLLPLRPTSARVETDGAPTLVASVRARNDGIQHKALYSRDLTFADGFVCDDPDIPLLTLKSGQAFEAALMGEEATSARHGRYGSVLEVGYVERATWRLEPAELARLVREDQVGALVTRLGREFDFDASTGEIVCRATTPSAEPTPTMERAMHMQTVEREFRSAPDTPLLYVQGDQTWIHFFWETDLRVSAAQAMDATIALVRTSIAHLSDVWSVEASGTPSAETIASEKVDLTGL